MPDITTESHILPESRTVTRLLPGQREEPYEAKYIFFGPDEFCEYGLEYLVKELKQMCKNEMINIFQIRGLELQVNMSQFQVVGVVLHLNESDYYSILMTREAYFVSRCINGTFKDYQIVKMTRFFDTQFRLLNEMLGRLLS